MGETLSQPEQIEKSTDPVEFLNDFHNSKVYKRALSERITKIKKEHPENSEADIEESFKSSTENYKRTLWEYYRQHPLSYDANSYGEKFNQTLEDYWNKKKFISQMKADPTSPAQQADFIRADHDMMLAHLRAADELIQEGKAPDVTTGRMFVQFLSIDQGLDVIDPDRDIKRMRAYQ